MPLHSSSFQPLAITTAQLLANLLLKLRFTSVSFGTKVSAAYKMFGNLCLVPDCLPVDLAFKLPDDDDVFHSGSRNKLSECSLKGNFLRCIAEL